TSTQFYQRESLLQAKPPRPGAGEWGSGTSFPRADSAGRGMLGAPAKTATEMKPRSDTGLGGIVHSRGYSADRGISDETSTILLKIGPFLAIAVSSGRIGLRSTIAHLPFCRVPSLTEPLMRLPLLPSAAALVFCVATWGALPADEARPVEAKQKTALVAWDT